MKIEREQPVDTKQKSYNFLKLDDGKIAVRQYVTDKPVLKYVRYHDTILPTIYSKLTCPYCQGSVVGNYNELICLGCFRHFEEMR